MNARGEFDLYGEIRFVLNLEEGGLRGRSVLCDICVGMFGGAGKVLPTCKLRGW